MSDTADLLNNLITVGKGVQADPDTTQYQLIVAGMTQAAISNALTAIRAKQAGLLNGSTVFLIPVSKVPQYTALLDVENILVSKYAALADNHAGWTTWLVDTALPELLRLAPLVLPLFAL